MMWWLRSSDIFTKELEWVFCDEFTMWYFASKCAALIVQLQLKFAKLWISSLFSNHESKVQWFGYVPRLECSRRDRQSPPGYTHEIGPVVVQGPGGMTYLRPCLVPSWYGARRAIWDCCWQWVISSPGKTVAPLPPCPEE